MQKEQQKTLNPDLISLKSSRLRQARLRCEMTIEEAARLTSLNKMTLQRYESGDIRSTSLDRLLRLAESYHVSPAWLAGIAADQEFLSGPEQLLLSPDLSLPPSRLGPRLLACLQFFSEQNQPGQA